MCKEQHPLSTVRFLGDALSLASTANTLTAETTQTTDAERTPEEIAFFHEIYLRNRATGGSRITAQDREEMQRLGIPPISEEQLEWAREMERVATEMQTDRHLDRWRRTGPRNLLRWLLGTNNMQSAAERDEYATSSHIDDLSTTDDDDDDDDLESQLSSDHPTSEPASSPTQDSFSEPDQHAGQDLNIGGGGNLPLSAGS